MNVDASTLAHIEEAIVGILLRKPERLLKTPIEARWFKIHRKTIAAMQNMAGRGVDVDAVSLSDELPNVPLQTIVGWQRNEYGADSNYNYYVEQLRQSFHDRGIRHHIELALKSIQSGEEAHAVVGSMMENISSVTSANGKTYSYNAKEAMASFIDHLERVFEAKEHGGLGLKSGINGVDDVLGGMHPTDMIVVGARPGQGKTAFALTVIVNLARQGKKVGFFSTEMSVNQVMGRMTSIVSGIHAKTLRDASMDDSEYTRLSAAAKQIQELPIMICDKPSISVSEIALQAKAWASSVGLDFIIVDYLTRVKPDKLNQSRVLEVGDIATGMKNMARTLNVPVMVLAQLNRGAVGKLPKVSDLRDSGIIEQEADQVLLLHRPTPEDIAQEKSKDNKEANHDDSAKPLIIVDKNRHGECALVFCDFIPHLMLWTDAQNDYR